MRAYSTSLLPLNVQRTGLISVSPYQRGPGFGANPYRPGFRGGCGCSPTTGCGCTPTSRGFSGFRQTSQDITAIENTGIGWLNYLTGTTVTPPSTIGGIPSSSSLQTTLAQYAPIIIGGLVIYMLTSRR